MKRLCQFLLSAWLFTSCNGHAATFTVVNTNLAGAGSLSNAIVQANATVAADVIAFNIPGPGVQTIALVAPLPDITRPLTLDGYTQPGSSPNTLSDGDNAVLLIEISGDDSMDGLTFRTGSANSIVRGLVLNRLLRAIHFNGANASTGGNVVEGCFIGTDSTGRSTKGVNSSVGVFTSNNGVGNRVGGTNPAARNLISCPTGNGIQIDVNSVSNLVQGNFIGVDATGTNALGAQSNGIFINNGAHGCLIGGATAAARNVITCGNGGFGVQCNNSFGQLIQGNFIGLDVTGTRLVGVVSRGIILGNTTGGVIGGISVTPGTAPGNVIAGGTFGAIALFDNAVVQGNLIGTDVTGTRDLGSSLDGIAFGAARNCLVGGTNAGARNVISGHNRRGLDLEGGATNLIQGNLIGTDITGANPLPNGASGIYFAGGRDNTIGPDNVIAFNGTDGITSDSPSETNNRITANAIFANGSSVGHLAIDLGDDGVTSNDAGDIDSGPNRRQNFPVVTDVSFAGGNVTLTGTFNSVSNSSYRLELFGNPSCDNSGNGEGRTFLGFTTVTTDPFGNGSFAATLPHLGNSVFTVTATDTNGNTSEFSACASVSGPCTMTCPANVVAPITPGQCGAFVNFFTTTSGNCGGVNCSPPSGSFFAKGTTTVVCGTVSGTNCNFTVTVNDTLAPALVCPPDILTNVPPGQTGTVANYPSPVVSDNCGVASTNCSPPSGSTFTLGNTTVICSASDTSGNAITCSFAVTVTTTNTPPVAQCRDVAANANATCQADVAATAVDNGSFDPDGTIVNRILTPPGPYAKGTNLVTLTVVDDRGGSNSCSAKIIVLDATPPVIACPGNLVTNAPHGQGTVVVNFAAPPVTDNCPGTPAFATCTPPSGSAFALGSTIVTCFAADASGNTNACSFVVNVSPTVQTMIWDGGGANGFWTNAANWVGDTVPVNGDGLVFPAGAARAVNTNTFVGPTNLAFIALSGSNYVLFSPPLTLLNGLTNTPPLKTIVNELHASIALGGHQTWSLGPRNNGAKLVLASNLTLSTFRLTVDANNGTLEALGNIRGSVGSQLLKEGSGQLQLNGLANDIPDFQVRDGVLSVDGVLSGALSISVGAFLNGNGTVPPFTCAGRVQCGGPANPGLLTVSAGTATFNGGSSLVTELFGSTTAGTDHDQLKVASPPHLSGASLIVNVRYSALVGERFVIITNTGAAPFSTTLAGLPEGATFEVGANPPLRTNEFRITYAGGDGNDVMLTLTAYKDTTAIRVWNGAGTDGFWTNPSNWVGNVAPNQGDNLGFPAGAARAVNTNNFPSGSVFNSILIASNSYSLHGEMVRINGGIHGTLPNGSAEVRLGITLAQPQTFTNSGGGTLNFFGPGLNNGGHHLTIQVSAGTVLIGDDLILSGAGGLFKEGPGILRLAGNASSTYEGPTVVNSGILELAKSSPNIAVPHDLVVGDGLGGPGADIVRLIAQDQIADASAVFISGSGLLDTVGRAETIGALTGAGALVIGNSLVCGFSGVSTFSGTISGTGGTLIKDGPGTLIFSGTNTHAGIVQCQDGILQVDGLQLAPLTRVTSGGRLQGSGVIGAFDINGSGGMVAPGAGPGMLTCSNYNADGVGNATLEIELNGPAPGAGHDQINVRGKVDVTGDALSVSLNFPSAPGSAFVIINNDGADEVIGTFVGKTEGATFTIGTEQFRITYLGGDGNDVALTQISGLVEPPRLEIERISANSVRLSWPTNPPGFNLEHNTNLIVSSGWISASPEPTILGTNIVVTNATVDAQRFYRLKRN